MLKLSGGEEFKRSRCLDLSQTTNQNIDQGPDAFHSLKNPDIDQRGPEN